MDDREFLRIKAEILDAQRECTGYIELTLAALMQQIAELQSNPFVDKVHLELAKADLVSGFDALTKAINFKVVR